MSRRKIKPTHMERTIFGEGSGSGLNNVAEMEIGRVGALSCWVCYPQKYIKENQEIRWKLIKHRNTPSLS